MYKRATGNITMRTGPGSSYPNAQINGVSQYVLNGDILEVSEVIGGWANIQKLYRNNVLTPIPPAPVWCGTAYLVDTTYTPPVPATEIHFNGVFHANGTITGTWTES